MGKKMKGFVKISKYAGMREDLVQAGGGNSAFKISPDKMVIKASGFQLADVTEETGYALVNPSIIKKTFLEKDAPDNISDTETKRILSEAFICGSRPSIETFLHAISGKYSLHTHPITVNALTCRRDGDVILRELFSEALFVPYATPGAELAKAYFKAYKDYKKNGKDDPSVVFLMNHGLLVSANSSDEVISITENTLKIIEKYLDLGNH